MYDRSIPVFIHGLTAMSKILDKAEADCATRKIDPTVLLTDRLYPDMLPFTRQIQIASDHARRGAARLAAVEPLTMADTEASFADLRDRIARSIENLNSFTPAQLAGADTRAVTIKAGPREMTFTGADYLALYAIPNFYFHLTVAHCILRANGVPIGKGDFLGG
jgi:hypothetical protein